MSYLRFNYCSQALSNYVDVSIVYPTESFSYFPPDQPRHHIAPGTPEKAQYKPGMKFQTIWLLQGGEADDMYMFRNTNLERYARENCVMIVCPRIPNSFGVDTAYGVEYSAFITDELPVVIQTLFASSPRREDNIVMGCAAGGNCALYNAVRHPERYAVCVDMSGGIGESFDLEKIKFGHRMSNFPIAGRTFGDPDRIAGSDFDMLKLTREHQEAGHELTKMIFIRGSEEGRIGESVEKDARLAEQLGYDTTYINVPGGRHNDVFWDEQFRVIISELLPLKRAAIFEND